MKRRDILRCGMVTTVLVGVMCRAGLADVPVILGGGNIGRNLSKAELQLKALNAVGAGMCRIPVSPGDYGLDSGQPRPERLDDLIVLTHQYGIEPIFLFEYCGWSVN